jgi:DNA-directed RNA polymerase subunit L
MAIQINPTVTNILENSKELTFTLSGIDTCFANAIRRTILGQIDRIVLGNFHIEENTSTQFHNEIIKHRLQCIPVHVVKTTREEQQEFCDDHFVELDVQNKSEEKIYVTTEMFRVINRKTGQPLSLTEKNAIFPPYKSFYYIDLMRLQPGKGDMIEGERIKLRCDFMIARSSENSCYSVVSKCAFTNTVDTQKAMDAWSEIDSKLREQGIAANIIDMKKRDFLTLDALRYYRKGSFDFAVRSIGIYENMNLVSRACELMIKTFEQWKLACESDEITIYDSITRAEHPSSMENSLDIVLYDSITQDEHIACGDAYSVGYILDHLMYQNYIENEKTLTYCGFTKFHPHNREYVLRISFRKSNDIRSLAKTYFANTCNQAIEVLQGIGKYFSKNSVETITKNTATGKTKKTVQTVQTMF